MELPRFITHNIEIPDVRELRFILFCDFQVMVVSGVPETSYHGRF
jgi:hypothetical protein